LILAILGGVLLAAGDIAVRAVRLRVLLGSAPPGGFRPAVVVNALGDAASALTPARLGGEPARFLALRGRGTAAGPAAVVLATERVVDLGLAVLVTAALVALLGTRGVGDVADYAGRVVSGDALPWVAGVLALLALFGVAAWRFRAGMPRAGATLRDALSHARQVAGPRLAGALALTLVSMAARVAVLPLLLWGVGALRDPTGALVGSFALIYAQLLLPTPAGAGGVELGFVLGVSRTLDAGPVAGLLVAWRLITLGIPAGLGGLLFVLGGGFAPAPARETAS